MGTKRKALKVSTACQTTNHKRLFALSIPSSKSSVSTPGKQPVKSTPEPQVSPRSKTLPSSENRNLDVVQNGSRATVLQQIEFLLAGLSKKHCRKQCLQELNSLTSSDKDIILSIGHEQLLKLTKCASDKDMATKLELLKLMALWSTRISFTEELLLNPEFVGLLESLLSSEFMSFGLAHILLIKLIEEHINHGYNILNAIKLQHAAFELFKAISKDFMGENRVNLATSLKKSVDIVTATVCFGNLEISDDCILEFVEQLLILSGKEYNFTAALDSLLNFTHLLSNVSEGLLQGLWDLIAQNKNIDDDLITKILINILELADLKSFTLKFSSATIRGYKGSFETITSKAEMNNTVALCTCLVLSYMVKIDRNLQDDVNVVKLVETLETFNQREHQNLISALKELL